MLFTKSRFKLALECPSKLWYNQQKDYKNTMPENLFMQFLADNGHAIGEYAKFLYSDNPLSPDITVRDTNYDDAVAETNRRLHDDIENHIDRTVIAEAAFRHKNYFIRVDVLIADHKNKILTLVEVKAKSTDQEEIKNHFKNTYWFKPDWLPYLYDVAFQTLVTEWAAASILDGALEDYKVVPYLLLINKEAICDRDGLNEFVQVIRNPDNPRDVRVRIREGTTRANLGSLNLFVEVPMRDIVDELILVPLPHTYIPEAYRENLVDFMEWASDVHTNNERVFLKPDKRCKNCQFKAGYGDPEKSGIHECFAHAIQEGWLRGNPDDALNRTKPLSTDIYGGRAGRFSVVDAALTRKHAFVEDIDDGSLGNNIANDHISPFERRQKQIEFAKGKTGSFYVDKAHLHFHMNSWKWPLHMIDFETTSPGIPYFKDMRPYELIAFQFSHHTMDKDGSIRHEHQFIDVDPGGNPNIKFVRELRRALMDDNKLNGTVFMYSKHERTTLKSIRGLIDSSEEPDRNELLEFIDALCDENSSHQMHDLLEVVLQTYISKHAGGSNSIKQILPAILNDAPQTAAFFSRPGTYGRGLEMQSLNFTDPAGHQWLTNETNRDPYKTLPPLFGSIGLHDEGIDEMVSGLFGTNGDTIDQGGLAMAAYNLTRYESLGDYEREQLRNGLLRYCELDTLAMCMLVKGLQELAGQG
jgi:hypothetical protein